MFLVTGLIGVVLALCWFAFYKGKQQYLEQLAARGELSPQSAY